MIEEQPATGGPARAVESAILDHIATIFEASANTMYRAGRDAEGHAQNHAARFVRNIPTQAISKAVASEREPLERRIVELEQKLSSAHGGLSCDAAEEDRYGLGAGYADFKADAERLGVERDVLAERVRALEEACLEQHADDAVQCLLCRCWIEFPNARWKLGHLDTCALAAAAPPAQAPEASLSTIDPHALEGFRAMSDAVRVAERPTIEQVAWVFERLREHLREPGTFRHLIYDRLGFDYDAYTPLFLAGGMDISNAFVELEGATSPAAPPEARQGGEVK